MKAIAILGGRDTYRRNYNYYEAVEAVGGNTIPVLTAEDAKRVCAEADGLVLPGGADVDPSFYGSENHHCMCLDHDRDVLEKAVIDCFLSSCRPILGICRGMQFINVVLGGTLIQDISSHHKEHLWIDRDTDSAHPVKITDHNLFMCKEYGKEEVVVNSAHHQAVDILADGLKVAAIGPGEIIEAFEHESLPVIGVQFHPERMCLKNEREDTVCGLKVFEYFMGLCS